MDISQEQLAAVNQNPLYKNVGIELLELGGGQAVSRLTANPQVCWPFPGQPHGGMLFTIMDTTMAWAYLTTLPDGRNCTTIDLSIQYTAPARKGPFTCLAKVAHAGGRTGFIRAEVKDLDGLLVASGQGAFRAIDFDMFAESPAA